VFTMWPPVASRSTTFLAVHPLWLHL